MVQFIQNLIGNDALATAIMSFIPLIELKGGIIFARGAGIGAWQSLGLSYLGSTAAFVPVFFLLLPVLKLLKKLKWFSSFAQKVEGYFATKRRARWKKPKKAAKKRGRKPFIKRLVLLFSSLYRCL